MKISHWLPLVGLFLATFLAGCQESASNPPKASADKASSDDKRLAREQRLCPVSGDPLGGMGTPVKVMVKNQPVLLCCESCREKAMADPDKTLADVARLKAKATDATGK